MPRLVVTYHLNTHLLGNMSTENKINSMQVELSKLVIVATKQEEAISNLVNGHSDHEKRLRWLERVIGYGLGGLGAAKFIWDLIAPYLKHP